MGLMIPNTVYDTDVNYHWQNANDRVAWQRAFNEGDTQIKKEAQALLTANPQTTNLEIQMNMNYQDRPKRFGVKVEPLTVEKILSGDLYYEESHVNDSTAADFSGSNGAYAGTDVPSLPIW